MRRKGLATLYKEALKTSQAELQRRSAMEALRQFDNLGLTLGELVADLKKDWKTFSQLPLAEVGLTSKQAASLLGKLRVAKLVTATGKAAGMRYTLNAAHAKKPTAPKKPVLRRTGTRKKGTRKKASSTAAKQ